MKETFKAAAVFSGTVIGAGLSSGREIAQFFSCYGVKSYIGIILCMFLYILFTYIILSLANRFSLKSYSQIVFFIFGKNAGAAVNLVFSIFMICSCSIMISGSGAVFNELFHIRPMFGIIIMILVSYLLTVFSGNGITAANMFIIPLSFSTILILGLLTLSGVFSGRFSISGNFPSPSGNYIMSTVIYSAFNIFTAAGVLCPLSTCSHDKKSFMNGCFLGAAILTLTALSINTAILCFSPASFESQMPNLYAASHFGRRLVLIMSAVIWLEMLSTQISNLFSLATSLKISTGKSYGLCLIIVMFAVTPLSCISFKGLIEYVYPAFGMLGMIFLLGCFLRYAVLILKNGEK